MHWNGSPPNTDPLAEQEAKTCFALQALRKALWALVTTFTPVMEVAWYLHVIVHKANRSSSFESFVRLRGELVNRASRRVISELREVQEGQIILSETWPNAKDSLRNYSVRDLADRDWENVRGQEYLVCIFLWRRIFHNANTINVAAVRLHSKIFLPAAHQKRLPSWDPPVASLRLRAWR